VNVAGSVHLVIMGDSVGGGNGIIRCLKPAPKGMSRRRQKSSPGGTAGSGFVFAKPANESQRRLGKGAGGGRKRVLDGLSRLPLMLQTCFFPPA
jgi:hypothetical protein